MIARRRVLAGGAAACAGLLGRSAFAQAGWPTKPIRLVIGYAPGGGADITARELTAPLSKLLGQTVVVDYKAGAGGTLAAQEVARAAPDGYTLGLLDNAPMTIAPALRPPGYDPVAGFTPISLVSQLPQILVAHPSVQASRSRELVALLKRAPGRLNFGSGGNGSVSHLAAELYKARSDTFAVHVPYRGGAPAVTALIAGDVQFAFLTYALTAPFIRDGKIKALGVTSAQRVAALPGVPTVAEDGLAGYEVNGWFAVLGPAGLPAPIVASVQKALAETVAQPSVVQRFETLGQAVAVGKADAKTTIARELATWKTLIAERKLVIEG